MNTQRMNRRTAAGVALALLGVAAVLPAAAQGAFPDKPIKLVVPFPPGGTSDISGRVLADALSKELGQPVIVENKAGAGGSVGARFVAEAKADGYTLLLGTTSTNGTNSAVYKNLSFDALKSFTPITRILSVPGVLAINKSFPAKNYAEFAKLVGQSPGKFSYASSGNGGATHMAMEYYKSLSGLRVVHVPYRGTGPALNDVIGGQVEMIYDTLASSMPHIKSGNLVPMALATPQRLKELPDVPTFAELGLKSANEGFWNGVLAPAGLPADVLDKLHGGIVRALRTQAVQDKFAAAGAIAVEDTPAAFTKIIADDIVKWKKVAETSHITAD
ncbi:MULTISPECIES: Bug family tripartite tricarboxylate transporter substrate binding protein [unclassified Acidovorax]|uniref:Bug family tripartite tricarboxylate transporter substrate binding protein n=1 Tax=unclassified Acidovorax TaxID=2684926 RepID=UPI000B238F47|nr:MULTISPECIES: tripartite tricarboxylate transporter substrate binding protein BugE [unclassified Acidovorax]